MATIEEAWAEAIASAPHDTIILHTLEINHKAFTTPLRVCRWPVTGNEPERFACLLEADAPFNPNEIVEYIGLPFQLVLPDLNAEEVGGISIRMENVGGELDDTGRSLDDYLESAALDGGKITAVYREFIKGREKEGPASVWWDIKIVNPHLEGQALVADGSVLDWTNRVVSKHYTLEDYPALAK